MSERTQVKFDGRTYEWDGADWWCPSADHDENAIDGALHEIVRLLKGIGEVVEWLKVADSLGDVAEGIADLEKLTEKHTDE